MGQPMNLSAELKEQTDRLYFSDPVKFKRVAAWVARWRKHGACDSDMAQALRELWESGEFGEWEISANLILERIKLDRASRI